MRRGACRRRGRDRPAAPRGAPFAFSPVASSPPNVLGGGGRGTDDDRRRPSVDPRRDRRSSADGLVLTRSRIDAPFRRCDHRGNARQPPTQPAISATRLSAAAASSCKSSRARLCRACHHVDTGRHRVDVGRVGSEIRRLGLRRETPDADLVEGAVVVATPEVARPLLDVRQASGVQALHRAKD